MNNIVEIVINRCYGGFGISREAIDRMIELGSEKAEKCLKSWGETDSYDPQCDRWDPILVQAVKELKNKACGKRSRLAIANVYLNNEIEIADYDGKEDVTSHECYIIHTFERPKESV